MPELDVPRFFLDENVRFPKHPAFAPGLRIRHVPRGLGVDFQGAHHRFILRGSKARGAYEFLREALDGERTLLAVLALTPDDIAPSDCLQCLKLLHQRGVLVEGPGHEAVGASALSTSPKSLGDLNGQYLTRKLSITGDARTSRQVIERLNAANVVSLFGGLIGTLSMEALQRTGIRTSNVDLDSGSAIKIFSDKAAAADLIIVASHGLSAKLRRHVNDICLQTRVPVILALENGEYADIMFVHPFRTACLECRTIRQALTSDFALEDYLLDFEEATDEPDVPLLPAGESIWAAGLLAAHVAGEAERFLGRAAPPVFSNASLKVDLVTGMSQLETVLRVPRCPSCSRSSLTAQLVHT